MDTTRPEPLSYPFNRSDTLELDERYALLRAEPSMARVKLAYGDEAWLATRYADARFVLGDARFSRVLPPGRDEPRLGEQNLTAGMLSMDPPEQTRIRRLATKAFTNRGVEALRAVAVEVADDLVTRMIEEGPPADLVANFAVPLPVTVICTLLGVPVEDHPLFAEWSEGFLSATGLTPAKIAEHQGNLWQYMAKLLAERTTDPKDDLLSALAQVRESDDRFTGQEILQLSAGLLAAGHETTMSQIPNFVLTLVQHPAELARIKEDPAIIPQAVEELMRYVPLGLGSAFPRYAKEDVEVGGVLVEAGEAVLAAIGSANRDDTAFPHADTLDVTRQGGTGPHIGFSHGAHHCLGAPLARMELQVALSTLVGRLPNLRLAVPEEQLRWKQGGFMRRLTEMPVSWG
ncbi:cytochrome P450 [Umezawaea sp. Da 62-37]|uniref:cytochrome P450 n=1 Tax=Umezawaea sp. Da 62-37 TaxID=3075927 RepID=UPI0028F743A5|nr:cytochrome P450 [Umezawaea sp. Da 62-37]WNV86225.1 cytochrome P450 [Umezawaea sp. Da 62-37]